VRYPETPDGRYFVAKARLWRKTDPRLDEDRRKALVSELMSARGAVARAATSEDERAARDRVDAAKHALVERGPVWWDDGAEDQGGRHPRNTTYAEWWANLSPAERSRGED